MLVTYGGDNPNLNVSHAKRSPHLNVAYLGWFGSTPGCFKIKKTTMPNELLVMVLGTNT